MAGSFLPDNPAAWTYRSWEDLMPIPREEREALQLEAVRIAFRRLRDRMLDGTEADCGCVEPQELAA